MGKLTCGKDRDLYRLAVRENAEGIAKRKKAMKKAKGR